MTQIRNIITLYNSLFLILLLIPISVSGNYIENCYYSDKNFHSIPIVAWRLIANNKYPSKQELTDIKKCGFNTAFYYNESLKADSVCQMAANIGLNLILGSNNLKTDQADKFINSIINTENILCWFLEDEPHYDNLHKLKNNYDNLLQFCQSKPIYINLVGSLVKKFTGNCKSMNEYLDTIENIFHPKIWSYDYYPVSKTDDGIKVNYNQFFTSLKVFHDQSQKTGKPFWAFCQSMEFRNSNVYRPPATIPYLRFEAFSALGFGAKGIVYWGYNLLKSPNEQYISALTDSLGEKTAAWYCAQEVNREIRAFNNVFNHSEVHHIHIHHRGLLDNRVSEMFNKPIDHISDVYSSGMGVLLSDFSSNGKNYILIMNLDIEKSQDIAVSLDSNKDYFQLEYKKSENVGIKKIRSKKYLRSLPPGGFTILSYNEVV